MHFVNKDSGKLTNIQIFQKNIETNLSTLIKQPVASGFYYNTLIE